jgi:hypothetical protein
MRHTTSIADALKVAQAFNLCCAFVIVNPLSTLTQRTQAESVPPSVAQRLGAQPTLMSILQKYYLPGTWQQAIVSS